MSRNLLAAIVLFALIGLTFVQFRLLVIGARLEKQRFDQKILVAQRNIRRVLNEPNPVSDALIAFFQSKTKTLPHPAHLADSLHIFLKKEMEKVDIGAQFSFTIAPRFNADKIEFSSNNYNAEKKYNYKYAIPLGDYFSNQLHRDKTLHIYVENLFGYLLAELNYLIIPSVLCMIALLVCLVLLINILQKEQKLNILKNDFINNLTHELKTPAFSISLSAKMAAQRLLHNDRDKVAEYLKIIENENNKIKKHTEKVLELASLENPRHQLQKEPTDLHALIRETAGEFFKIIKNKNGKIIIELNARHFILKIDKTHFSNAVYNLLDNAVKYSFKKPFIEIFSENKNGYFILSIKNNGPGIPPSEHKYIFDKFYRVPSSGFHQIKGFGLGLNYVKQVVEAHRGRVSVESKPGEGATFIIQIPG